MTSADQAKLAVSSKFQADTHILIFLKHLGGEGRPLSLGNYVRISGEKYPKYF